MCIVKGFGQQQPIIQATISHFIISLICAYRVTFVSLFCTDNADNTGDWKDYITSTLTCPQLVVE
jgi:hypothetical protein